MIDAVVLAGAPNTGALKEVSGAANEALIDVCGHPMISYVISALRDSGVVGRIIVVGPPALFRDALGSGVEYVDDEGSLLGNLFGGLRHVTDGNQALVATSDIPFLTAEGVTDFVARCSGLVADLYYPVVERSVADARFPGVQRTYVRLVDGEFTGGNMVLLTPKSLFAQQATIKGALDMRKKPVQLARMLGVGFIVKFLLKRLCIADIELRVGAMLGIPARCIITPYAEVGVDVDKPSDLELARRCLA